jgi:hypothetical protein
VDPTDAAKHVLEQVRMGKQVPRHLRRAARAIARRSIRPDHPSSP